MCALSVRTEKMKKLLRKWLGISELEKELVLHAATDALKSGDTLAQAELKRDLGYCVPLVGAIMDYLELDARREFVPDFSRLPEQQPMRERIIVVPRKVNKKKQIRPPNKPLRESTNEEEPKNGSGWWGL